MIKQTLPIALGAMLACGVATTAEAQLSASGKLEAKAKVDVSGASAAKAKLEAQKKAAAEAKAKAEAQGNKTATLRAKIKAPIHAPTANIRADLNTNIKGKKVRTEAKAARGATSMKAGIDPRIKAKVHANANASFQVPPPNVSMQLYGEGYAKLSAEEKLRVRTERRAAHWAAFKTKHQAKITVDRPKLLAPPFHAEFEANARRIAKLQRIRFLAQGKNEAKIVAKADALMEKENARHAAKLASLVEGKAEVEGKANVAADVKAKGAVNANEKAVTNANENSAVKKPEGNKP